MVQVKICGLRTREAVEATIDAGADFIGLVHFARSPRHVSLDEAAKLAELARGRVKSVLLLVDPSDDLLDEVKAKVETDYVQLHGGETAERAAAIREKLACPVIKAAKVETREDVEAAAAFLDTVDLLLFDAKPPKDSVLPGGNGIPFDWTALTGFNIRHDFMLSGGLDPSTVAEAVRLTEAPMVDVSSGVEKAPGIKDLNKIRLFVERAKAAG